jgi:hypothetical protein
MRRLIILIALFPAGTVYADPVTIQLNDGVFALSDNVQTEFPELWGDPTFTGTIAYDDSAVSMTNWQVNLRTGNGVEFNASGPRVQLDDDTWYMSTMAQSVAGGIDNYFLSYLWLHLNLDGTGTTSFGGYHITDGGRFPWIRGEGSFTSVPEPATLLSLVVCAGVGVLRRARHS